LGLSRLHSIYRPNTVTVHVVSPTVLSPPYCRSTSTIRFIAHHRLCLKVVYASPAAIRRTQHTTGSPYITIQLSSRNGSISSRIKSPTVPYVSSINSRQYTSPSMMTAWSILLTNEPQDFQIISPSDKPRKHRLPYRSWTVRACCNTCSSFHFLSFSTKHSLESLGASPVWTLRQDDWAVISPMTLVNVRR
jgi:hypothetical protein